MNADASEHSAGETRLQLVSLSSVPGHSQASSAVVRAPVESDTDSEPYQKPSHLVDVFIFTPSHPNGEVECLRKEIKRTLDSNPNRELPLYKEGPGKSMVVFNTLEQEGFVCLGMSGRPIEPGGTFRGRYYYSIIHCTSKSTDITGAKIKEATWNRMTHTDRSTIQSLFQFLDRLGHQLQNFEATHRITVTDQHGDTFIGRIVVDDWQNEADEYILTTTAAVLTLTDQREISKLTLPSRLHVLLNISGVPDGVNPHDDSRTDLWCKIATYEVKTRPVAPVASVPEYESPGPVASQLSSDESQLPFPAPPAVPTPPPISLNESSSPFSEPIDSLTSSMNGSFRSVARDKSLPPVFRIHLEPPSWEDSEYDASGSNPSSMNNSLVFTFDNQRESLLVTDEQLEDDEIEPTSLYPLFLRGELHNLTPTQENSFDLAPQTPRASTT